MRHVLPTRLSSASIYVFGAMLCVAPSACRRNARPPARDRTPSPVVTPQAEAPATPLTVTWTLGITFRRQIPGRHDSETVRTIERSVTFTVPGRRQGVAPMGEDGDAAAVSLDLGERRLGACLIVTSAEGRPPSLMARLRGNWHTDFAGNGSPDVVDEVITLSDERHLGNSFFTVDGREIEYRAMTSLIAAPSAPAGAIPLHFVPRREALACVSSMPDVTLTGIAPSDFRSVERGSP